MSTNLWAMIDQGTAWSWPSRGSGAIVRVEAHARRVMHREISEQQRLCTGGSKSRLDSPMVMTVRRQNGVCCGTLYLISTVVCPASVLANNGRPRSSGASCGVWCAGSISVTIAVLVFGHIWSAWLVADHGRA